MTLSLFISGFRDTYLGRKVVSRPGGPRAGMASAGGLGALRAPLAGFGAEPQPKSNLLPFSPKIPHQVATISIIFNAMQTTNFKVKNIWGGNASPASPLNPPWVYYTWDTSAALPKCPDTSAAPQHCRCVLGTLRLCCRSVLLSKCPVTLTNVFRTSRAMSSSSVSLLLGDSERRCLGICILPISQQGERIKCLNTLKLMML